MEPAIGDGDYEGYDPQIKELVEFERKVVTFVLGQCTRLFPDIQIGHEIKEVNEAYFSLYLQGPKQVPLSKIKRLLGMYRSWFRYYEVAPDPMTYTVGLTLTFYRADRKGQKPLVHDSKNKTVNCPDMRAMLAQSDLTSPEINNVAELIEQFMFVEKYVTGSIHATLKNRNDFYTVIFSNVQKVPSGFLASYLEIFERLNLDIEFTSPPFEVHVTVFRETPSLSHTIINANKKRVFHDEAEEDHGTVNTSDSAHRRMVSVVGKRRKQ
jgi:hypothetical protein